MNDEFNTSSFDDFVSHDLDLHGVGDVTCATVHPIVAKTLEDVQDQPQVEHGSLSIEARQTAACLSRELVPLLSSYVDSLVSVTGEINPQAAEHFLRFVIETGYCALIDVLDEFDCHDDI